MRWFFAMLALLFTVSCVNKQITKTQDPSKLTIQQVIADFTSGDFRRTLLARSQLSRLAQPQKIEVLKKVIDNPDPSIRMTAISEFTKLGKPACPFLQKRADTDPDQDVKQAALDALKTCQCTGPAPAQ